MGGRWLATVFAMLAVAFVAMGSGTAVAAPSDPLTPPSPDEAYRRAIQDGVTEYEAGHFEEARSLFRHAHELSPNARTHRGIGMTSFELRDYVAAVRNLAAALEDKRKPLTPDQRTDVVELLDRSRRFVDVYRVLVDPPDARLLVDGRQPEYELDGTLLFGFGTHTVEATASNREPLSQTIEVRGGATKELRLVLERAKASRPTAALPSTTSRRQATAGGRSNTAALACLWAGVGAAVLAGTGGYFWYQQSSELDLCNKPAEGMRCTTGGEIRSQRNIAMATTIGAGAAAVTLGVLGVVLWDSGGTAKSPDARRSAVDCVPNGYGITCGGRF